MQLYFVITVVIHNLPNQICLFRVAEFNHIVLFLK